MTKSTTIAAAALTASASEALEPEDWPLERFSPSPGQAAASVGLALGQLAMRLLVGWRSAGAGLRTTRQNAVSRRQ